MEKIGNVNHNHCVTADIKDPVPFCYTTDPNVRYEYCDCDDNQMGLNYPDYNYQNLYNGKFSGFGGNTYSRNAFWGNDYGPYGGVGSYGGNPNSLAIQLGRCGVSTTIQGFVMVVSDYKLKPCVYFIGHTCPIFWK